MSRSTLLRGVGLGVLYGIAQILQTTGLAHTSASVSGFITGLYVVATPLLGALILRSRISRLTWLAAGLATVGLGVLSLNGFSIGYGELLTLASAIIYAGHIVALGRLSGPGHRHESQRGADVGDRCAVLLAALVPTGDTTPGIQLPSTGSDWLIVGYLAVIAGAMTMVLQTWAQARIEPSRAAVVMAMEPVWAAGFAVALGGEQVTVRMVIGGLATSERSISWSSLRGTCRAGGRSARSRSRSGEQHHCGHHRGGDRRPHDPRDAVPRDRQLTGRGLTSRVALETGGNAQLTERPNRALFADVPFSPGLSSWRVRLPSPLGPALPTAS